MGRKTKYITDEQKLQARKDRQMKYYWKNQKKRQEYSLKWYYENKEKH